MNKIRQADILKVASVIIAAPRYMGAFAAAIGISALSHNDYQWIERVEVYSGLAMAILEGFALAFVWGKWNKLTNKDFRWYVLLFFIITLALTIPFVSLTYLLMEQDQFTTSELFGTNYLLQVLWTFLVAGVPMFIIMAVGFADSNFSESSKVKDRLKDVNARDTFVLSPDQDINYINVEEVKKFYCQNVGCNFTSSSERGLNVHKARCKYNE